LPPAPVDPLDALERELDEKIKHISDKPEPKGHVFGDDAGLIEYTHKLNLGTRMEVDISNLAFGFGLVFLLF
jgi:hypothetical protein